MIPFFRKKTHKLRHITLRILISLFVPTVLIIMGYMQYIGNHQALILSKKTVENSGKNLVRELNFYLKPQQISSLFIDLFQKNLLNTQNSSRLSTFMEGVLKAHPMMSSIYVVDKQGNFSQEIRIVDNRHYARKMVLNRPQNTRYITFIQYSPSVPYAQTWIYKDKNGQVLEKKNLLKGDGFDPFKRPWYQGVKQSKSQYWADSYEFFGEKEAGITVAFPLNDTHRGQLGVVAADYEPVRLTNLLQQEKATANTLSFIVNNENKLLAYSEDHNRSQKNLVNIAQLQDQRIADSYQQYLKIKQPFFSIKLDGSSYIAFFKQIYNGSNESWVIGMLTPLEDFTGPITQLRNISLLFCLAVLFIGIGLTVLISRRISQPIAYITQQMENLRQFKLDSPSELESNIDEIQQMLDGLKAVKASLQSFSAYVPKEVVATLIQQKETATLGLKKQAMTVLFTDISGFSAISAEMPVEQIAVLLGEYFELLSGIIKVHGGTIDKYTGDGIMAFWGAPNPDPRQAIHACQAALSCQEEIKKLNETWARQGKPRFNTRIGINSGTALVGNIGSKDRMNYTLIGETVNNAAYIEAMNKNHGTEILVGEEVYEQCPDQFSFKPQGMLTIKGGSKRLGIYSLHSTTTQEEVVADDNYPCLVSRQEQSSYSLGASL